MAAPYSVDPHVKAAACADLATGSSLNAVADRYGLTKSTVQRWRDNLQKKALLSTRTENPSGPPEQPSLEEFGRLLSTYVKESLETLVVQVRHARDPAWLKEQDAGDLAVLHGVLTDKIVRLLEAAERAAELRSGRGLIEGAYEEEVVP